MTRTMVDSLAAAWPAGSTMIAAYINGALPASAHNYAIARGQFPDAQILSITTNGDPNALADISDGEAGDYTPAAQAAWCNHMIGVGHRPTAYRGRDTVLQLIPLLAAYGLELGPDVDWWCPTLDGTPGPTFNLGGITLTAVAVQTHDDGLVDWSTVYDDRWHPSMMKPTPPAPPAPTLEEPPMYIIETSDTGRQYLLFASGRIAYLVTPGPGSSLTTLSPPVPVLTGWTQADVDSVAKAT